MKNRICPICDEGILSVITEDTAAEHKGVAGTALMAHCVCDTCGSESAGSHEMKYNRRAILAFRRSVDGLLPADEIKRIRKKFGLTQPLAGKLFGGGPVAFNKYENNEVAQSEAMDGLLRLVDMDEESYWSLVEVKGLSSELMPSYKQLVFSAKISRTAYFKYSENVVPIEKGSRIRQARFSKHGAPHQISANGNGWQ